MGRGVEGGVGGAPGPHLPRKRAPFSAKTPYIGAINRGSRGKLRGSEGSRIAIGTAICRLSRGSLGPKSPRNLKKGLPRPPGPECQKSVEKNPKFGRREKTPTPKTRVSIWTLLRTPGRFTTRPLPVYFTTKLSVARPFSVLSKDEIGP